MKRSKLLTASTLLSMMLFLFIASQRAAGQAPVSSPPLSDEMGKFFSGHCTPCHYNNGEKMAMFMVNFDDWTKNSPERQYEKAQKITKMVSSGKMPKKSEVKKRPEIVPTKEQIEMVKAWAATFKPVKK
jgi:hypothetical protein